MTASNRSRWTFFPRTHDSPISRIGLLLVLGLAAGCSKTGSGSPTAAGSVLPPGSTIVYDAVGASDADGVGSSVVCPPFLDCPNGTGYPQVAARQLSALGFVVSSMNLGIPTAVIGRDFQALSQQFRPGSPVLGNLIDGELPFIRTNATLVTIFAGGNEINTINAALGSGAGAADQAGYIDAQVRAFAADYITLLNGIRARAPAARIIALNVPNLAGLPFLAQASLGQRQAAQRAAVGMANTAVNVLVAQNVTVIDVMCDPRMYLPSNYSGDGFHPNDAGYAFIAGEIVRAVTSSAYPAPQSNCAFMSIVPGP